MTRFWEAVCVCECVGCRKPGGNTLSVSESQGLESFEGDQSMSCIMGRHGRRTSTPTPTCWGLPDRKWMEEVYFALRFLAHPPDGDELIMMLNFLYVGRGPGGCWGLGGTDPVTCMLSFCPLSFHLGFRGFFFHCFFVAFSDVGVWKL